jgi:Gpi16 subunit, GPI transamidase component
MSRKRRLVVNRNANGFRPFRREEDDIRIGSRWRMLRSLTSGVFCAFLNQNTIQSSPFSFIRSRHSAPPSTRQIAQYFSEESVCTENIDAWLKLIPHLSSGSVPHTDTHLKSLVWRDWILHSPWHSLSFEARDTEEISTTDENSRNTCDIMEQQSVRCNNDKEKKEKKQKIKTKSVMSMNLTISAVLLPNILPSHADVLLQLKEHVNLRSHRHRQTDFTSPSSDSKIDEELISVRATERNLHGGVQNLDGIKLRRQVIDSRERNFYVHMSVKDSSVLDTRRYCSDTDSDTSAIVTEEKKGGKEETTGREEETKGGKEVVIGQKEREKKKKGSSCILRGGLGTKVHVVELLPPFYEILLNTYTYLVHNSSELKETHGHGTSRALQYVADLPSFIYTPKGLSDKDCYDRDVESVSCSSLSDRSFSCFGSISWTLDLPIGASLASSFTAEKRYLHREEHPSDASRGLVVPPAFVVMTSYPQRSKWPISSFGCVNQCVSACV